MLKIDVIGSGSSGNCYLISTDNETLVIECGVKKKDFLNAINYNTRGIVGCLISHEHSDHSGALRDFIKYGFPIMASEAVFERLNQVYKVPVKKIYRNRIASVGGFQIVPFKVPHNETECDGFYIKHSKIGNILFITDAEMCPYNMSKMDINYALIECNYSEKYVDLNAPKTRHILAGHMSLNTCKNLIKSLDTGSLKSVGLIHLSKDNSDPDEFLAEVQSVFNGNVWIANRGFSINFEGGKNGN